MGRFGKPRVKHRYSDILWSDPVDNEAGICDPAFTYNAVRGCSYYYGYGPGEEAR